MRTPFVLLLTALSFTSPGIAQNPSRTTAREPQDLRLLALGTAIGFFDARHELGLGINDTRVKFFVDLFQQIQRDYPATAPFAQSALSPFTSLSYSYWLAGGEIGVRDRARYRQISELLQTLTANCATTETRAGSTAVVTTYDLRNGTDARLQTLRSLGFEKISRKDNNLTNPHQIEVALLGSDDMAKARDMVWVANQLKTRRDGLELFGIFTPYSPITLSGSSTRPKGVSIEDRPARPALDSTFLVKIVEDLVISPYDDPKENVWEVRVRRVIRSGPENSFRFELDMRELLHRR